MSIEIGQKVAYVQSSSVENYFNSLVHEAFEYDDALTTKEEAVDVVSIIHQHNVEAQAKLNHSLTDSWESGDKENYEKDIKNYTFTKEEIGDLVLSTLLKKNREGYLDCGVVNGRQVWTSTDYFRDYLVDFHEEYTSKVIKYWKSKYSKAQVFEMVVQLIPLEKKN